MSICHPPDVSGRLMRQDRKGRWTYQLFALKDSMLMWFRPESPIKPSSQPLGMECLANAKIRPIDLESRPSATGDVSIHWGMSIYSASSASQLDLILVADTNELRHLWVKAMIQASIPRAQLIEMLSLKQARGGAGLGIDHQPIPRPHSALYKDEDERDDFEERSNPGPYDEQCNWEAYIERVEPKSKGCVGGLLAVLGCGRKSIFYALNAHSRHHSTSSSKDHSQSKHSDEQEKQNPGRERRTGIGRHRDRPHAPFHLRLIPPPLPVTEDGYSTPRISVSSWCSKESSPPQVHITGTAAMEPKLLGQIPLPRLLQSSDMTAFESQLNELHSTVTRLDSTQRLRQASVDSVDRKISYIQSMVELRRMKRQMSRGGRATMHGEQD